MITSYEHFIESSRIFVDVFNRWVETNHPNASADHLCYKCNDRNEYEATRAILEKQSSYLYQSTIAGRHISVIKLTEPIKTDLGDISFIELSDQKPDGSQSSGFDHIEICPREGSMEQLAEALSTTTSFEKTVRPHHTTYDATIFQSFKVRLEEEPLIEKIKREEMS